MTILPKRRRCPPARAARPLLIVARDQQDLYHILQRAYRDTDELVVLRDRRQGERRRGSHPVAEERRHGDRRCAPPLAHELGSQHFALVYPASTGARTPRAKSPRWRSRILRFRFLRDRRR